jgi:hypothetical protein
MASDFRPFIEILRELHALALNKASGFFFIVTEDSHSCTIRLRSGQVEDIVFGRQRNDEAVQRLQHVAAGRARFQAAAISAGNRVALSEASMRWLLGGFEQDVAPMRSSAPSIPANHASTGISTAQREAVEKIALNYFGPIASLLCDEAFSASSDIEQVLAQIATNLPTRDEAQRFVREASAAVGKA